MYTRGDDTSKNYVTLALDVAVLAVTVKGEMKRHSVRELSCSRLHRRIARFDTSRDTPSASHFRIVFSLVVFMRYVCCIQ